MTTSDCFVSVVAPLKDDEKIVTDFLKEVVEILKTNFSSYELIMVDDGSADKTVSLVEEKLKVFECIRLVRLSRHFGEEVAISAGLDSAIGDFIVVMMPNNDPPFDIPEMVSLCRNGTAGIVTGVRAYREKEPFWSRIGADLFYWYTKRVLDMNLPKNSTQFRVLSRQAVNAITQVRDQYRYIRLISNFIGYSQIEYTYEQINRSGKKQRRGFWQSINMAADIVIANSAHPLRVVSVLGLIAGLLNLLYITYVVLIFLFKAQVAEGWTTTNFQSALMFFFIFVILTVLSEYVGRILNEARRRPLYYIFDEKNSSVMLADAERRNVVEE
jgi:glycosyltransferase involved in cell wall biosynthesis